MNKMDGQVCMLYPIHLSFKLICFEVLGGRGNRVDISKIVAKRCCERMKHYSSEETREWMQIELRNYLLRLK